MNALISGRAGLAVIFDGDSVGSIHAHEPDRVIPRRQSELPYLLRKTEDFELFEDFRQSEIVEVLLTERQRALALQLALYVLDPNLSDNLRCDASSELDQLLHSEDRVTTLLEEVLFAHPLPSTGDLESAFSICRRSDAVLLLKILERLSDWQPVIARVRKSWEAIPRSLLGDAEEFSRWQAAAVRLGLFRRLVIGLSEGTASQLLILKLLKRRSVARLPEARQILLQWIRPLMGVTEGQESMEVDRVDEEPRQPPLPRPATRVERMRRIYSDADRVAHGDIAVLIRGESGTGKEVLARYLHAASLRSAKPFVALNCAALPRDLLELELFGIESGVATGLEPRPGKFEMADGGTLFLDEIGDLPLETQARILRVLEEGEVYRLDGQKPYSANVRVVATTNRDLEQMMSEGSFSEDLYYRVAVWTVEIPPLHERRADIANLATHFLDQETRRRGIAAAGISRGAMDLLESYDWPGNVRELKHQMARAALLLEDGDWLESSHLSGTVRRANQGGPPSLKERLEKVERAAITKALSLHQGSVPAAAKELRLGVSTLYRRMRELEIDTPD